MSSGCSLVAGQSTRCPGFPEHRSKCDLCDVVRTSVVSLPDLAVLVKQRVAWLVLCTAQITGFADLNFAFPIC